MQVARLSRIHARVPRLPRIRARRRRRAPRYRRRATRSPLSVRVRHVFEEASVHVSETFAELADWLRLGR
jgi:hypothetical protein